ncbi:alpha/beta fold hydrolase [Aliiglaciecola sp. CAU 1673]|uniref:alpha/beta hydrolase n=1 Tax=Aliiglaciecola sp. CAU 1673 TaxID=3032595 RepID=UPI0023DBE663|nr:alpha/beta fold hydrolase [Aliiglaciecola sp. CAU 1673]MDF2176896.1 alpha/beta fold hydrolase [Aliiglaciecola sp. CAU 1673]
MLKKCFLSLTAITLIGAALWYALFALKPAPMAQQDIVRAYQYEPSADIQFEVLKQENNLLEFRFTSFDGAEVFGQLGYPQQVQDSYPLLLGVHAMGRSYPRWWLDSLNGNPTVTQVHRIGEVASQKGYVVVALDARFHGKRKDPQKSLKSIMLDLYLWGEKNLYEDMVRKTAMDYRVLLDYLKQQPQFANSSVTVAGYSMGGQISLLLGALDNRVDNIIAIVPPYLDDKVAMVAPKNLVNLIEDKPVLLVTADDDENASIADNDSLFSAITSPQKQRLQFPGGHILPPDYVQSLEAFL